MKAPKRSVQSLWPWRRDGSIDPRSQLSEPPKPVQPKGAP